jgi:hypothetical protein
VEFKRALDTGNSADDVVFDGSPIPFFVAVHNNSGDANHFIAGGLATTEYTLAFPAETTTTTTTTTTTATTTTTTPSTTPPPPPPIDQTLLIAAALGGIVVILLIVVFIRRGR